MPIDATWLIDKRVIYFRAYGTITGAELVAVTKLQLQHHDEGIAPVHTIVDMRSPSINIPSLTEVRHIGKTPLHPNTGWMVMFNSERNIVMFGTSLLIQMIGSKHLKAVKTVDEAVEFLNHNDSTLNLTVDMVNDYIASHTTPDR